MISKEKTTQSDPERNALDLPVSTPEKAIIEVGRGRFIFEGVEYDLDDEVRYTVLGHETVQTDVRGFLALNPEGAVEVVVDEHNHDGIDVPFIFNGSGYRLLSKLFACRLPPGPVDLSSVEIAVWKVLPPVGKAGAEERVLNPRAKSRAEKVEENDARRKSEGQS